MAFAPFDFGRMEILFTSPAHDRVGSGMSSCRIRLPMRSTRDSGSQQVVGLGTDQSDDFHPFLDVSERIERLDPVSSAVAREGRARPIECE